MAEVDYSLDENEGYEGFLDYDMYEDDDFDDEDIDDLLDGTIRF